MIAYLHAETVKRSAGRSIVASSAYISGEKETNEYTGLTHDYRSKSGIVHSEVLLPPNARNLSTPLKSYGPVWNVPRRVHRQNWG